MGSALLKYKFHQSNSIRISCAFDVNEEIVGRIVDGIQMCIRDSIGTFGAMGIYYTKKRRARTALLSMNTVSYTHLDVYKRQCLERGTKVKNTFVSRSKHV